MPLPGIVYKVKENSKNGTDVLPCDDNQCPLFSDEQMDTIAALIAMVRDEWRDEIQAAIDKALLSCVVNRICMKRSPNCAVSSQQ